MPIGTGLTINVTKAEGTRTVDLRLVTLVMATLLLMSAEEGRGQDSEGASSIGAAKNLPLAATRLIRFRTRQGTGMSIDVSRDGRTIVFDLLGDLYTMPSKGGHAKRITSGMALNQQPRLSPDGRHIAFVSDRGGSANLWIAGLDGNDARQLSNLQGHDATGAVTSPAWSPDGRTIVVAQRLSAARPSGAWDSQGLHWLLAAYDVETGRMRWLSDTTRSRIRSALGPTFGPQADLVYAAVDTLPNRPWWDISQNWSIVRIALRDGRTEWAPFGRALSGMRPAVSPNGEYLAYASLNGSRPVLSIRNLRTGRERVTGAALDDSPGGIVVPRQNRDVLPGYTFTPDSRSLVVSYNGTIHRIELASGRAAEVPFVADVERGLAPFALHQFSLTDTAVRTRGVLQPALSPDGARVAFSALDRIWVMELPHDGQPPGVPHPLTADDNGEFYPSWSPDGTWIAYSSWKDGVGGAVRRAPVIPGGSSPAAASERISSDSALYFHTAVALDGRRIVAVRAVPPRENMLSDNAALETYPSLGLQLVWIPETGGNPQTITSLESVQSKLLRYPTDQVYFTHDSERIHVGLTSWRWDGTGRRTELPAVGSGADPNAQYDPSAAVLGVLAPDRSRALMTRQYTLFEATPPALTAARPDLRDTLYLERARTEPFGGSRGAARRWGTVLQPWISWSLDGRRVLFSQGGTLFIGQVQPLGWTRFSPVEVPLLVPVDRPHGTLVLHGARLITMRGQEVIGRGDLVVQDNRITAVGPVGKVDIPKGAHLMDVTGTTILPGYVDLHDHMLLVKGVHSGQCWQCLARLAFGVTTSRDPEPSLDNDVFTYQERERSGDLLGPRIFSTGIPYFGTDPPIETLDVARDAVRPNAEYFHSETFKIYYDESTDRRARQLLAAAVAEEGLNPTVHTNGLELLLAAVIDGLSGTEHPPHIRIYDDVATLFARSGTTFSHTYYALISGAKEYVLRLYGWPRKWTKMHRFVPPSAWPNTCYCPDAKSVRPRLGEAGRLRRLLSGAARIEQKKGLIGIGSHGDIVALGYHYEMWLHKLGGMTTHGILRSATIVGATAIGHARDLGSLEAGKLADLQILGKNPLLDIQNTTSIQYVMKNGRLYQAEDLTQVWPDHKPLPPIYIWDHRPVASPSGSASSFSN